MLDDAAIQAARDRIAYFQATFPDHAQLMEACNGWRFALDALVELLDWGCARPDWPGEWGHDPHRFHPDGPGPDPHPDPGPHVGPAPQPRPDPHPQPQPSPSPRPQPGPHDPHGRP
jgi:hypothetical protein